jgi:hypothetical protein
VLFFQYYKQTASYKYRTDITDWLRLHALYNSAPVTPTQLFKLNSKRYFNTLNNHFFKWGVWYGSYTNHILNFILKYLIFAKPLFKFSIYSIDKRMRKLARKKGTKYVFLWKYVPIYKRSSVLLKFLADNLKFAQGRTLDEKLYWTFLLLRSNPKETQAYQINNFTHNYVFRNLKRSLLTNFKTTA